VDVGYWRGAAEDEAMQDEHGFIWTAMLEVAGDLRGARVLDAGCNRGGFLRLLADHAGIAEGFGYDPAKGAVDDARSLAGSRPLRFEAASTVPAGWSGFDAAFSHEVLYLISDMGGHAADVFRALKPGGCYYATIGVHTASRLMSAWHAEQAAALGLPRLYSLDEVAEAFEQAGFDVSAGRLPIRFVPVRAHRADRVVGGLAEWIDYYCRDKTLFRFTRPAQ